MVARYTVSGEVIQPLATRRSRFEAAMVEHGKVGLHDSEGSKILHGSRTSAILGADSFGSKNLASALNVILFGYILNNISLLICTTCTRSM
jgi:hypothetical protein